MVRLVPGLNEASKPSPLTLIAKWYHDSRVTIVLLNLCSKFELSTEHVLEL